jgi:hypothetical protein
MQVSNPDEELKIPDRYAQYRARHPLPRATKAINGWIVVLTATLIGLCVALLSRQNHPALPKPPVALVTPAPVVASSPVPVQAATPVPIVPRADPVVGPLTTGGAPMLSSNQYYVRMPDGRNLLVNYKGWVDHACNLPRQPKGGANNAAYTEAATGHTWIWTVPAGTSNVPQWIPIRRTALQRRIQHQVGP